MIDKQFEQRMQDVVKAYSDLLKKGKEMGKNDQDCAVFANALIGAVLTRELMAKLDLLNTRLSDICVRLSK